jgi:coiled-coil domain-containing protein 12
MSSEKEIVLSRRNFDPETRTLRKRTADDDIEMEDTVEKEVAGLVEDIVAEDELKRAQELVRSFPQWAAFTTIK